MLQITPEATRHLLRLREQRGVDQSLGARLVSNGARVGLTFTPGPGPDDRVADGRGIAIYVAPEVAAAMNESIIDAREEGGKTSLVLRQQSRPSSSQGRG